MIFWVPVSRSVPHLLHLLSPDLVPPSLPSGSHLGRLRDLQLTYWKSSLTGSAFSCRLALAFLCHSIYHFLLNLAFLSTVSFSFSNQTEGRESNFFIPSV